MLFCHWQAACTTQVCAPSSRKGSYGKRQNWSGKIYGEVFFFQILNVSTYKISHFGDRETQFQQVVLDYKIKYNMKLA